MSTALNNRSPIFPSEPFTEVQNTNDPVGIGTVETFPAGGLDEFFEGHLDEVGIWNVGRSGSEIQATMGQPLTGNEPGLAAYHRFEELEELGVGGDGLADDVRDLSSNGNHGDLAGEATLVSDPDWAALLTGQAKDAGTGNPLTAPVVAARLPFPSSSIRGAFSLGGSYTLPGLWSGNWLVIARRAGYGLGIRLIMLDSGETETVDFALVPTPATADILAE